MLRSGIYLLSTCVFIFLFSKFVLQIACIPVKENVDKTTKLSQHNNSEYVQDVMRLAKVAEMKNYMNEDIDPCTDFYEFACGKWPKVNPALSFDNPTTGLFEMLTKELDRKVVLLLKIPPNDKDTDIDKKVKNFYESCMKFRNTGDNYRKNLIEIINEFGDMPALSGSNWNEENFDWLETIAKISHKYGQAIIFETTILADFVNNTINRVYFAFSDLKLESKSMYVDEVNAVYRESYKQVIQGRLMLHLDLKAELAKQVANEIVNFEIELAKGWVDERLGLGLADLTTLTTVEDLQKKYAPIIDVKKFLNITLGEMLSEPIYESVESYQENLMKIIPKTPKKVLANYIFYSLLDSFFADSPKEKSKLEQNCVDKTKKYFAKNIDNMIYRQYNTKETEDDIALMWRELKETFKSHMTTNKYKWIDEATRQYAVDKLDAMKLEINSYENTNFTAEFHELDIAADDYIGNIKTILEWDMKQNLAELHKPPKPLEAGETLSYTPANIIIENVIKVPVSVLQPYYLYATSYPQALKFGNLGSLVGHELIHGFDDTGRKYDKMGNNYNWWSSSSTKEFQDRTKCFTKQYSRYSYAGRLLPETALQSENIADNGGLRLAYAAYIRWYEEAVSSGENLSNEILPNMNYTSKQLFFISFAQMWCNDVMKSLEGLLTATDSHVPGKFRVIGPLSNFDEFAKEFQCAAGTNMNTKEKCEIY